MPKDRTIARKELNIIAKKKGIKEPHKMPTKHLIDTINRYYSKRKSYRNRRKIRKMGLNKYIKNKISQMMTKLQNISTDDLKKIAILQRIKNYDKLSREDLIYTLLRSESNPIETNYEKCIINRTDDEIKSKVNNIRILLSRLGDITSKDDRDKVRKSVYEIEKKKKIPKTQKERILRYLIELINTLNKKEEYKYIDYDDLDYFRIKDREILFINITDGDYYKPTLVKSYEIRGDRDKKLSVKQYLTKIIPQLTELINEKKNNDNEQKIQLSMGVNFISSTDTRETRTFYVKRDNEDIRLGIDTSNIINKLYELF